MSIEPKTKLLTNMRDNIVYKDKDTGKEIPFQEFIFLEFQMKYPQGAVDDAALTLMKERG